MRFRSVFSQEVAAAAAAAAPVVSAAGEIGQNTSALPLAFKPRNSWFQRPLYPFLDLLSLFGARHWECRSWQSPLYKCLARGLCKHFGLGCDLEACVKEAEKVSSQQEKGFEKKQPVTKTHSPTSITLEDTMQRV